MSRTTDLARGRLASLLLLGGCASAAPGPSPVAVAPPAASASSSAAPPPARPPVLRPERAFLAVPRPRFVELHLAFPPLVPAASPAPAPPEAPLRYGAPLPRAPEPPRASLEPLERARSAAPRGDPAWVEVSRRLLQLRWRAGQEAAAAELALETAQAGHGGPPDDLWLRAGFALGALGRHEEAAGAFAKVSRREWEDPAAALRALALHRAGQPQQALAAALAALDLLRAPGKTAPGGGPPIERWGEAHDAVRRVAVDALDLLGVAPDGLPGGSAENQALVLGVAARRALFRGQAALARARAEQALRLAPRSREAAAPLEVLWRLAERAGDAPGAERYQAQLGALRDEGTTIRLTPPGVEEEEAQQMGEAPTAERLVEALVRLCAEPLAWKAAGGLGKLTIEARVYDDGKVEPRVLASGNEATQAIGACVRQQAPSALEAAPSLRVTVELARLGGPGRPR